MAKNKLTKFAEMASYENVFHSPYEKLKEEGFSLKGKWHTYFKNDNPIILELGCGKGEYTVGLARKFPECNFIGIDIKDKYPEKTVLYISAEKFTQQYIDSVKKNNRNSNFCLNFYCLNS